MTEQIVLTRTGDSNWYIKDTSLNDTPERTAYWVRSLCCGENVDKASDDE